MINKMMKKTLVLVVAILAVFNVNAQSKFGDDEQACKENISMFREYYKQKNYTLLSSILSISLLAS